MADEQRSRPLVIGYLSLLKTLTGDGYLGAILVTDGLGTPLEFRCTHSVKPTAIQKPLYGNALEPYVGVRLCGVPLIQALENKPKLVVVQEGYLLGVRPEIECPAIHVRLAGEAIEVTTAGSESKAPRSQRIDSPSGRFQPVVLAVNEHFPDDLAAASQIAGEVFLNVDILEPFARVAKAIEVLAKQDPKFQ